MRILIVKTSALGDVLRTTSVARALKRRDPESRITWVASRAALPLLEGNPDLERTLAIEDDPALGREFDLVLSMEEDAGCARLAAAACAGELVGVYERSGLRYTDSSARYYDMSLLGDRDGGRAEADRLKAANRSSYAELWLEILGLPVPDDRRALAPVLVLSEAERKEAARSMCARAPGAKLAGAIGLNAGAGARWPAKQLSEDASARAAEALAALGRTVVLLGGSDEAERHRRIAARVSGALDPGARPLRAFAALVSWLGALVTTDSLALHVATALGVPAIALIGPTSAAELDVFGRGEKLAAPCGCFYRPRCVRDVSCLDALEPRAIAEAARRWLS